MASQVLIYDDLGVNAHSARALFETLKELLDPSIFIRKVDSHFLVNASWENKTVALVMGGGICRQWDLNLGERGIKKIRNYVFNGGQYIGFCAGAYFACQESCFTLNNQSPIEKRRALALFSGRAVGPIFPTQESSSVASTCALTVSFKVEEIFQKGLLYYQEGPLFNVEDSSPHVEVIGRYQDLPSCPAAILLCRAGKGRAFLSGVHPEFAWSPGLEKTDNAIFAALARVLSSQEVFRKRFWKELGRVLHLPMKVLS
jgi:glutamine amidotransferase-like uncharacterized protein